MDLSARLSAALSGQYEIQREIGRGGMSVVFLAKDLKHNRDVAVKVLRPELTESVGAERFQREVEIVSHLEHIHILPLFDSGTANGVLYYVMPYVDGGSLRDRLRKEAQLGIDEIVRVTKEVADGISYANERGIIHRDIKPENIMFVNGHAVVADFGIAHAYSEAGGETVTEQGVAIGTPDYMSPEQAAGDARIDHRSDVYSLACVVYEMLSGGPPFEGATTQAVLAKHMQERVPSLAIVRPGIPRGMVDAVERALEKVPGDRFDSAAEFAVALEVGRATEPASGAPSLREAAVQLITTPWVVAVVALVAAGLAAFPIAGALLSDRGEPAFEGRPESVVVLPYHTATSDERERALATDLAGEVTRELNRWESVRAVRSVSLSGPMFDLGITGPTLEMVDNGVELTRALGAQALVAITIEVRGDSIEAAAELVDAGTGQSVGRPILATGEGEDCSELAAPIAYAILGLGGLPEERGDLRRMSAHPEALVHDIAGTSYLERWRLEEAERSFRQAIALDSTFAMALHHLAQTLYWQEAQGTRSNDQVEAEIAQLSTAAVRHSTGLTLRDSMRIAAFHSFQDGGYQGYAHARAVYRTLLESDSTDVYDWLMLGSVEWDDQWLEPQSNGEMLPRGNLNVAQYAFAQAVTLQPRFDLGYGHLGDMYRDIAGAARGGGCTGYEVPREDMHVEWDFPSPDNMIGFCAAVLDSITWLVAEEYFALPFSVKIEGANRLMEQWNRLVRRWASYAPDEPKPLRELTTAILDKRRHLGDTPPRIIDSLTRLALNYTTQALALQHDTLPGDLARLGSLYLGVGDLDTALALTDEAFEALGPDAIPSFAVNVYLAAGQPSRALAIVSTISRRWYKEDPETGGLISYGGVEAATERIRVLAATGVGGELLERELAEIRRVWWGDEYTAHQRDILRRDAVERIAIISGANHPALVSFASGLEWDEPFWKVLLQADADLTTTRAQLLELVETDMPALSETSRAFLLGLMASRAEEYALAAELFSRLDSLPSSLGGVDASWGLRTLSYRLRAEAYEAGGDAERAREWEGLWGDMREPSDSVGLASGVIDTKPIRSVTISPARL